MVSKKSSRKGQGFSMDIMIVVAVLLFGVIFLVASKMGDTQDYSKFDDMQERASEHSRIIVDELKANNIIDKENNVAVENLLQMDVQALKEELNIKNDFCIVFEKNGQLVKIDPDNDINGIGSNKIVVNNVPCKSS